MKKLIAIGVLGLALSFPALSFASDYMCWVPTKLVVKSEVRNEIKGGDVEKDFISFYIGPKEANIATSLRGNRKPADDRIIHSSLAFGFQSALEHKRIVPEGEGH